MNNFRTLKANEIECRIAQINKDGKGLSLLLYKDARVDQNLLDETVGPLNWQRSHQLIGDRLYCTVSIYDADKQQWISKQDVGTESYTEKEKGQASDSFKRACFNFGIGRELYTAPFIWINAEDCNITKDNKCYDNFEVTEIGYNDNREINLLEIVNNKNKKVVFTFGKKKPATKKTETKAEVKEETKVEDNVKKTADDYSDFDITGIENEGIDNNKITYLKKQIIEREMTVDFILNIYRVKKLEDLKNKHFMHIISNWDELKKRFDKA